MIDGEKISLGGKEFVVPPLSFKQLRKFLPMIHTFTAGADSNSDFLGGSSQMIDTMLMIILAALNRNYPDMTPDDLEELLDVATIFPVFKAVIGVAGLVQAVGKLAPGAMGMLIGETSTGA